MPKVIQLVGRGWQTQPMGQIWPTACVLQIKLYWHAAMPICVHSVCGCLRAAGAELGGGQRPRGPQHLALCRKLPQTRAVRCGGR